MTNNAMISNAQPFMSLDEFNTLVEQGDYWEIRFVVEDIVSRWWWIIRGTVELPFDLGNVDLIDNARSYIKAAQGAPIPVFPLSPMDYPKTQKEAYNLIPGHLLDQIPAPKRPTDLPEWFYTVCEKQPTGEIVDGQDWNAANSWSRSAFPASAFETWLFAQARRVYRDGDPLADRKIRALWLGYTLHRSKGQRQQELVWQATHLPLPALVGSVFGWVHTVDRPGPHPRFGYGKGAESDLFDSPATRDQVITTGLEAIAAEGGWPRYAADMADWQVVVDFAEQSVKVAYMHPGLLAVSEEQLQVVGNDHLDEFLEAAANELTKFGFRVNPISFGSAQPQPKLWQRALGTILRLLIRILFRIG